MSDEFDARELRARQAEIEKAMAVAELRQQHSVEAHSRLADQLDRLTALVGDLKTSHERSSGQSRVITTAASIVFAALTTFMLSLWRR